MDPDHSLRVAPRQVRRHARTPITALSAEAVVAETAHQFRPRVGDARNAPSGLDRFPAPPVTGQRRHDDVIGLAEAADHLHELDERARPAVGEDERQRSWGARGQVQEVDGDAVDVGHELVDAVEPLLPCGPVILIGPVATQVLDVSERDALRPVRRCGRLRPPGGPQASLEFANLLGRHRTAERSNRSTHQKPSDRPTISFMISVVPP